MNKNLALGILVVIILGLGAYLIWGTGPAAMTATSTPSTTTSGSGTQNQPAAPLAVTSTLIVASNSSAVVTGKVTPNGAQTTYWYDYGPSSSLGMRTSAQVIGSGYVAISAPAYISGLSANTTYYDRLSAQNAYGTVTGATYSFTTNNNPPPAAHAPTVRTNAASNETRTSADIAGSVNPNGADASVWFEYGPTSDLGNLTAFEDAGSGTGSVTLTASLSGLNPSTTYYFRVDAQNAYGTENGAIQSFTTAGPPAPGEPSVNTTSATNIAATSLTMNGSVNPEGDATSYWFEYGTNSLLGSIIAATTPSGSAGSGTASAPVSADVGNLAPGTTYYYRLVAQNSYGTVTGNTVTVKTKSQ